MQFKPLSKLAGAAITTLLATAFAAEAGDRRRSVKRVMPPPASYSWTGFYLGVNGGAGFDTSNFALHKATIRTRGVLIGGTVGYNRQIGRWVLGLEGDFDWSDASGRLSCGNFVCEAKNNWLDTFRVRFGHAFDRWLPYLTAGGAYGHVTASSTDPTMPAMTRDRYGWAAGLGVEYAFGNNWSAKLEYLYVCLGDVSQNSICRTSVTTDNISIKQSVLRAGINFKFLSPVF